MINGVGYCRKFSGCNYHFSHRSIAMAEDVMTSPVSPSMPRSDRHPGFIGDEQQPHNLVIADDGQLDAQWPTLLLPVHPSTGHIRNNLSAESNHRSSVRKAHHRRESKLQRQQFITGVITIGAVSVAALSVYWPGDPASDDYQIITLIRPIPRRIRFIADGRYACPHAGTASRNARDCLTSLTGSILCIDSSNR